MKLELLDSGTVPESVESTKQEAKAFATEHIEPHAEAYFDRAEYPHEIIQAGREAGIVGGEISEKYGGRGFSLQERLAIAEEFFRVDAGIGFALQIASNASEIYEQHGTEEQKERYLPALARGDALTGIAVSEPENGSDLVNMTTTAERDGGEWVLNGEKYWIGNAVEADWVTVYAKTGDGEPHSNYSLFIIPTDAAGYQVEHLPPKMSMRANKQGHITLEDCRIPAENILGKEGLGFQMVVEWFNVGRVLAAGHAIGLAAGALEAAHEFVTNRIAYEQPVSEFQTVQHDLAEMRVEFDSARMLAWRAAEAAAQGEHLPYWSAGAKLKATETAVECAEKAMRLHGGRAVLDESHITRIYRDVRGPLVYDGVPEILRDIVYQRAFDD